MRVGADSGTVRSRLWRDGALAAEDFPFEMLSDYLDEDGCLVWVDIRDPDPQHLNDLAEELTLDPHAVEDSLARIGRAKATRYATHTFLTTYATSMRSSVEGGPADDRRLVSSRISAFILRRGIVTIRQNDDFDISDVVQRWDDNADLLKYGVGALVYGLLDVIVDGHFDAVQALDDSIESLEGHLFDERAPTRDVQQRTYRVRKDLVELRRVVLPMREVVNALLRHRKRLECAHRTRPLVRRPLRPCASRDRMDRVAAADDRDHLRNQSVPARFPAQHSGKETDRLGCHHRRSNGHHRLLRPKRALPRLRSMVGMGPELRHHRHPRQPALHHLQTPQLALDRPVPYRSHRLRERPLQPLTSRWMAHPPNSA